ncbi:serine acetyltransferase [Pseudoalteromonas sp.]|uniref:serine O-acetyltransferase n=1 Tax=Pseudoalteromonas sp. TaxID=53249 RepID=UPI002353CA2A|nr:serine acetyltransferase [Pseudoalteromonas sp.]
MTPFQLIKSDLSRQTGCYSNKLLIKNLLNSNRSFKYIFWWRLTNSNRLVTRIFARYMHTRLSIKYQIQIPKEAKIGAGLNLGHATGIVISPSVEIGINCNISQFVNIGSNHGKAALIGDNVYIGPMVCIVENVVIGNNVTIGAGSIVVKNIEQDSTAVGNPCRIVHKNDPARYIKNQYYA